MHFCLQNFVEGNPVLLTSFPKMSVNLFNIRLQGKNSLEITNMEDTNMIKVLSTQLPPFSFST
jgi:hypothetical protein